MNNINIKIKEYALMNRSFMRVFMTMCIGILTVLYGFTQPSEWDLNFNQYQNTMTAVLQMADECNPSNDSEDFIAAFDIYGEIRGVAQTDVNGNTAFMTIYSNGSGEKILFKVYDNGLDEIYEVYNTHITYIAESTVGFPMPMVLQFDSNGTAIGTAGEDQEVFNVNSAQLAAEGTGAWSILQGPGGNFSDITDPNAVFTGAIGIYYTLVWTQSDTEDCIGESDEMILYLVKAESENNLRTCNDGLDNDGDGLYDCDDPDCGTPKVTNVIFIEPTNLNCGTTNADGGFGLFFEDADLFSIDHWMTSQNTSSFSFLTAGDYIVELENSMTGCRAQSFITIDNPADDDLDGICNEDDLCPGFDDMLIGTPCDDGNPHSTDDQYISACKCMGTLVPNSDCIQIEDGDDDVEENGNDGTILMNSSDIDLTFGESNGAQVIGLRFNNIPIPNGSIIYNAYIQFTSNEITDVITNLTITGEAIDNAPAFIDNTFDVTARNQTMSTVQWTVPIWDGLNEQTVDERTPDISSIINEIIDRPGYQMGNSMVMIIDGAGDRTAYSFEGDSDFAPTLCVEYLNCTSEGQSCDDLNVCTINDTIDEHCNCVGTLVGDFDQDGICDVLDSCPTGDDHIDWNGNFIPDSCESCLPSFTNLGNDPFVIAESITTENFIQTKGNVLSPKNVVLTAGDYITLEPVFEVKLGAELLVQIDDCEINE